MPLILHFLNVGHGDCTIVQHPTGNLSIVDVNNITTDFDETTWSEILGEAGIDLSMAALYKAAGVSEYSTLQSLKSGFVAPMTDPLVWLKARNINSAFRYVQTHPDMDHMRGLEPLLKTVPTTNFWDTANTKPAPKFRDDDDRRDWAFYQETRANPGQGTIVRPTRGDQQKYYGADDQNGRGDCIEILSPTKRIIDDINAAGVGWNDQSLVLRITHAGRSVLLCGDAEEAAWADMLAAYGTQLACDVLKAPHHGRSSGYHRDAVKVKNPWLTVVSVGKKPSTDASSKYANYSDYVWSTRYKGDISVTIYDNGSMMATSSYNAETITSPVVPRA